MTELNFASSLLVRILPLPKQNAVAYIRNTLINSETNRNVIMVPSTRDAEELAQELKNILPIIPIRDFEDTDQGKVILYQESFDKICTAEETIKRELITIGNKEGWKNFSKQHNALHTDKDCPYYQQNKRLSQLYKAGGFFALIASINTMAGWDFGVNTKQQFNPGSKLVFQVESSFAENIIVWLKDGYRENRDRFESTLVGKTQRTIAGYEEYEYEDQWGHARKGANPKHESKPIEIKYTGKEASGYKQVKDASYPPIRDAGWIKETETNFVIPSKLTLIILNALTQNYDGNLEIISVHADIFREELEKIDGCDFIFPEQSERKPKIKLVKTDIRVNLGASRARSLKKSLPVLKQLQTLLRSLKGEKIDIAFLHFKLKELGNAIKSTSKKANEWLEEFTDFRENLAEIKNLRYHYLNGPNSNWDKILKVDPQNALYDKYLENEDIPKLALIYGTPRFMFKDYSKQEWKYFSAVNKIVSLPPKNKRKEFFENYCKRLAYLLNLYHIEQTYIVDPYFQYGFKNYDEIFARYFEIE